MALSPMGFKVTKPLIFLIIGFVVFTGKAQELVMETGKAVAYRFPIDETITTVKAYLKGSDTPLIGSFITTNRQVTFTPRIPFHKGMEYELVVNDADTLRFHVPETDRPIPELTGIIPVADTLPENLLKIYLEFSAPMQANTQYQFIKVYEGEKEITPFLNLTPELWNYENQVMTLWLDPGRIKSHLLRNQKLGKPLEAGKTYTLVIEKGWKSREGMPLQKNYIKNLYIGPRDAKKPEPDSWTFSEPSYKTREPLVVNFGEPLDHQLLKEVFSVDGVEGVFETGQKDKQVTFTPKGPWNRGTYELVIESRLEDLAGNNLNRVFDRDIETQEIKSASHYRIPFQIN